MNTEENFTAAKKPNTLLSSFIIAIGVVLFIGGIYSYFSNIPTPPKKVSQPIKTPSKITPSLANTSPQEITAVIEETEPVAITPITPIAPITPQVEKEIEKKEKSTPPLPSLDNSDTLAVTSALTLSGVPEYPSLLIEEELIRNFVVFVDNFSRGDLVSQFSPIKKPDEKFSIDTRDQKMFINTQSYTRYNIYTEIINSINVKFAITQYRTLKPLFDAAYQEIGYPDSAFEESLNNAIEIVLDTPIINRPIELVTPSVMYKFADPQLEALADAQKLLIRMGPDNLLELQAKLQQFQNALQAL